MSELHRNLLRFGRLLRALDVSVPAGGMIDVSAALAFIDIGRRSDFYFTLRSVLVHRREDLAVFDEAFAAFWRRPPTGWTARDLSALGERRRFDIPESQPPAVDPEAAGGRPERAERRAVESAPLSYSAHGVSRTKDFARFTDEEIARARAMMAKLRWNVGLRKTRRWLPGRGRTPDLRQLARRNLQYGGEPLVVPTRTRKWKRRPLVLICDVSGSMERYARMLLHFVHSLAGGAGRVEAFLFSTRLTRITRELRRRGVDDVVPAIPRRIPDWAGGTRIGDALRTFNLEWSRRVLTRGPVVLVISDGWDRGEPDLIRREMGRLQRTCHRLVWLNPLLGSPDYRPLTRGMRAALPLVDDFLPVHNFASLEGLANHLNTLPPARGARRNMRPDGDGSRA